MKKTKNGKRKTVKKTVRKTVRKRREKMEKTKKIAKPKIVKLNNKEDSVLQALKKSNGKAEISALASKAFPKKGSAAKTKGNSWVRNSLRRLLKFGFVTKVGKGTYEATKAGNAFKNGSTNGSSLAPEKKDDKPAPRPRSSAPAEARA